MDRSTRAAMDRGNRRELMTTVKQHAPGTVSWVDLTTPDPEGAQRFYGELFGWKFSIGGPETGHYTMCQLGSDSVAGLGAMPPGAQFPSAWTVYFATADADASAARIGELGGQVMMGPMDVMQQGRMLVAMDPCGAAFGLWQAGEHTGAARVDEPGAMAWREVNVRDAGAAKAFYTALFGLEARVMPIPEMTYHILHHGDTRVGGILQMNERWPAEMPAHWMSYFAVDDCDAAAKRVAVGGGKVHLPPFDTPYGRVAIVADPWGAIFSIMKPAEQMSQ
jgi:uncharacterized protein